MVILTDSLTLNVVIGFLVFLYLIYKFWTRKYDYWEKRGVTYVEPNFPLGTLKLNVLGDKPHYGLIDKKLYDKYKGDKYVGTFALTEPHLFVIDLDIVKLILTKDFSHFVDRGMFSYLKDDFCSHHLFNMEGAIWRNMRAKLSPSFTSSRMKLMFNLIEVVDQQLKEHVEILAQKNSVVAFKDLMARYTIDVIATCAFGLEVNTLTNPDNIMRKIANLNTVSSKFHFVREFLLQYSHCTARFFKLWQVHPEVAQFCLTLLKDTMEYRKKHNVNRNDFIDLMTKVKNKTLTNDKEDEGEKPEEDYNYTDDDKDFTLKEMTAQVFVFFAAGFETSSSALTFFMYEMSQNKDIQEKVREEIDEVMNRIGGKLNFQALQEFRYLDMCINETLRRYASVPFLRRRVTKNYKIPDTDLVLEKNMMIKIPTHAIHHDPEIYPDPYRFDPERFNEENVKSRHTYAFLPFGEGPRVCIGKRFGLMEVKMAVITLLKEYEVSPAPGLPSKLPIDNNLILTNPAVPINLIVRKRKQE